MPTKKVAWIHPSNEARYLTGVLGTTGGLQWAMKFLLHPFLRDLFAKLGGTPNLPTDQMTPTVNRLQKIFRRQPVFDLSSEEEREALANLIVKASKQIKNPMEFEKYENLKAGWETYRATYWKEHPQQGMDTNVDWDRYEEKSLDACLVNLRHRQILYQGYQWTCQKCHHKNWVDLEALSSELSCGVCKQRSQAPVDIHWLFRPNEFLIESLRDRSTLSLVWVLSALCDRSRRSLIFVEPTSFGFDRESDETDAEADLLILLDGRSMICEVKTSWRSLRLAEIPKFVELACRLRPDIALLAVMESGSGPTSALSDARRQLTDKGIEFELLTPTEFEVEDDPYLPFNDVG